MSENIYERLRVFMDSFHSGFPATPTGVEIKILKKLFSPDEAELTMKLKTDPEEVSSIAARIGMDEVELSKKLEEMASKGLVFRVQEGDKIKFNAFQFVVGIYEFQINRLDREFCELFEQYLPYLGMSFTKAKTRQMRVIPVASSVKTTGAVADYNMVRHLVAQQDTIALSECICRKEQGLLGNECDRPKETCLGFGVFGKFYIQNGWGKSITKEQALSVLDKAEAAGLVLSPSNTQRLEAICCCCPCCCPTIKYAKLMPRPVDMVRSYYYAKIDSEACSSCGQCTERCQVSAIKEGEDGSEVIDGRCIGCGLCVSSCPENAISLVAKSGMEAPPATMWETLAKIEKERMAAS